MRASIRRRLRRSAALSVASLEALNHGALDGNAAIGSIHALFVNVTAASGGLLGSLQMTTQRRQV